jgi:hypothetical protein
MKWALFGVLAAATSVNAQPGCTNAPALPKGPYIKVNFVKNDLPNQRQRIQKAFNDAAAKWSSMIVTDLPDIKNPDGEDLQAICGQGAVIPAGTDIQNMVIFANVANIDGAGKLLAQARSCLLGNDVAGKVLPRVGVMTFDSADVAKLIADGKFDSAVLHEMGHILGIGNQQWRGRVTGQNTNNPAYTGAQAVNGIRGFNNIGGEGVRVPVEGDGGPGTALTHWDETTFGNELMTGFLSGQTQPLSAMTLGSLIDLGYQVNRNRAETFTMPGVGRLLDEEDEHEHERMLAEGGWEEVTWPDMSKGAAFLGEDGVISSVKASQDEAEILAAIQAETQATSATDSSAGSSTGAIVGAAAGGALAMLAVVAVAANYRAKKTEAVTPMHGKYLEGQL